MWRGWIDLSPQTREEISSGHSLTHSLSHLSSDKMLLERPLVSAVVASLLSAATCLADEEDPFPPDMSMGDLASYWGFRMETHHVTTDDGYVLKLHRCPSTLLCCEHTYT